MLETLRPPKGATLLLNLFANEPDFPQVEGDLSEEFQEVALQSGPSAARQWYWREALRNVRAFVTRRESINALGAALLSLAIFRLAMPSFSRWLRIGLVSAPRLPGLGVLLLTLFGTTLSFLLGAVMSRMLRGREPLLRLGFAVSYLVSVATFVFRSGMYQWWSSSQFSLNLFGLLCVITGFWIGSLCSERRNRRRLSLS